MELTPLFRNIRTLDEIKTVANLWKDSKECFSILIIYLVKEVGWKRALDIILLTVSRCTPEIVREWSLWGVFVGPRAPPFYLKGLEESLEDFPRVNEKIIKERKLLHVKLL